MKKYRFNVRAYTKECWKIRDKWLKYSKSHLTEYPNRKDRYNAFLRECFPKQEPYTTEELVKARKAGTLAIPLTNLIAMGNERNWLCKAGRRYKNCYVFANVMNGLYLKELRKNGIEYNDSLFDFIAGGR